MDSQFVTYSKSSKELFFKYLEKASAGDLVLLDKINPSISIFFLLKALGIDFCARMKDEWLTNIDVNFEDGEKEKIIRFKFPQKDHEFLSDYSQLFGEETECRLVRFHIDNGEIEIICTSLVDSNTVSYEEIANMYHQEWNIGESVKLLKNKRIREFNSGMNIKEIKRGIFAKIFMISLCALLAFPLEKKDTKA